MIAKSKMVSECKGDKRVWELEKEGARALKGCALRPVADLQALCTSSNAAANSKPLAFANAGQLVDSLEAENCLAASRGK